MTMRPLLTDIDGTWHTIGEDGQTECGLDLGYGWAREAPLGEAVHCGPDAPKATPTKPKANVRQSH